MAAPVILVEAQPAIVATGAAVTVRLAGGGAAKPYVYGGSNEWRAGIRALPTMIASLAYEGGEFPAGSVPSAAAIEWQGSNRALLATLAGYMWADAPITVRIGPEGALPPVVISGKVLTAMADGGKLTIALADPAAALKKPLLTARFAGTGGLEGPADWEGRIRRRVWGRIWNLAGEPIDKANNVYCFADPLRPIHAFDAVRDKGAPAAALTMMGWQGSAAATFAALQAASAPPGGGVVCPSIACIKWWTQPAGDLCADLRGEVGAAYVETTAGIAQRLVEAASGPGFTAGTIAAANAARPAAVGWLADDDSTTAAAMLDELLGNSSLLWLLEDAGTITVRPWAWGAPVVAARSEDVDRKQVLRPVSTRRLGYKRNENQMARGDLAAIVLSSDVNYLDGTPIEDLRPAELGANITENRVSAAIAGQGALATLNAVGSFNFVPNASFEAALSGAWTFQGGAYCSTNRVAENPRSGSQSLKIVVTGLGGNPSGHHYAWWYTSPADNRLAGACVVSAFARTNAAGVRPFLRVVDVESGNTRYTVPGKDVSVTAVAVDSNYSRLFIRLPANPLRTGIHFRLGFDGAPGTVNVGDTVWLDDVQINLGDVVTDYTPNLVENATRGGTFGVDLAETAGGAIATLPNFRTNLGTAAAIAGQGDLATLNRAALPFGVNAFVNSDLAASTVGWEFIGGNPLPGSIAQSGRNMPGYFGRRNTVWARLSASSGNVPAGTWFFGPAMAGLWAGSINTLRRFALPVAAGDRIFAQGRFSIHGGVQVNLRVRFWNEAGNLISEADAQQNIGNARLGGPSGLNGDLANYAVVGGFFTAPAGACYATWGSIATSTGDVDLYLFVTEPILAKVPASQTAGLSYSPGPPDRAADATGENIASAILGQGPGATAPNLAAFDPTAAAQLSTAVNGGAVTVGPGETIKRKLPAGASIAATGQAALNAGGSSGTVICLLQASLAGSGSWSTFASGAPDSVGPGEPGTSYASGGYTNTTGAEQLFEFRVDAARSPGGAGGAVIPSQTFITC